MTHCLTVGKDWLVLTLLLLYLECPNVFFSCELQCVIHCCLNTKEKLRHVSQNEQVAGFL